MSNKVDAMITGYRPDELEAKAILVEGNVPSWLGAPCGELEFDPERIDPHTSFVYDLILVQETKLKTHDWFYRKETKTVEHFIADHNTIDYVSLKILASTGVFPKRLSSKRLFMGDPMTLPNLKIENVQGWFEKGQSERVLIQMEPDLSRCEAHQCHHPQDPVEWTCDKPECQNLDECYFMSNEVEWKIEVDKENTITFKA